VYFGEFSGPSDEHSPIGDQQIFKVFLLTLLLILVGPI